MQWVLVLGLVILCILALIVSFQQSLLFYPETGYMWEPKDAKLIQHEGITAWYWDHFPGQPTVLFCHGNTGNISFYSHINEICKIQSLNLLLFDYTGYGRSKGVATPSSVCDDGEKMYRWLTERVPPEKIIVWGESLGGAVATFIASRHTCKRLVLLSTFSSIGEAMIESGRGWLAYTLGWALYYSRPFTPLTWMQSVRCPVLIVHSTEDDLIPYTNAQRLYDAVLHQDKKKLSIKGGHTSPLADEEQIHELFDFCGVECKDVQGIQRELASIDKKFCGFGMVRDCA